LEIGASIPHLTLYAMLPTVLLAVLRSLPMHIALTFKLSKIVLEARSDYAQLHKIYGAPTPDESRYSPATCIGCDMKTVTGDPDPKHVSTSFVERANLTMRHVESTIHALDKCVPARN
jgi:hypothetical protein